MRKKLIVFVLLVAYNTHVFSQSNKGLSDYGISIPLLVAGFFGALLSVTRETKSFKQNVLIVITGAFSSMYLTPFILELFNYTSPSALGFFGFIVGTSSIKVVNFLTDKFFGKDDTGQP